MHSRIEAHQSLPTIGQFYSVRCAKIKLEDKTRWVPVLCDHVGEISGRHHFHVDVRFISERTLKLMEATPIDSILAGPMYPNIIIRRKRKKCLRQFPVIKVANTLKIWTNFKTAQEMNKHKRVICNTCPHHGVNLSQVPVTIHDGELVKVCPAHGLVWREKDGKMVERKTKVIS